AEGPAPERPRGHGDERLRHVRVLGPVHLDPRLFVVTRRRGWARALSDEDDDLAHRDGPGEVVRVRALRFLRGRRGPPPELRRVPRRRRRPRAALRDHARAGLAPRARPAGRVLRDRILLGGQRDRLRAVPDRGAGDRDGPELQRRPGPERGRARGRGPHRYARRLRGRVPRPGGGVPRGSAARPPVARDQGPPARVASIMSVGFQEDRMPATTPVPDDDERVPIFGTWPRIYAAVILCELASMALIALFSSWNY